jgi:hypothetical protein
MLVKEEEKHLQCQLTEVIVGIKTLLIGIAFATSVVLSFVNQ